jgi:hypothetical protein
MKGIEYHLGKVFTKLGINSRIPLHQALVSSQPNMVRQAGPYCR